MSLSVRIELAESRLTIVGFCTGLVAGSKEVTVVETWVIRTMVVVVEEEEIRSCDLLFPRDNTSRVIGALVQRRLCSSLISHRNPAAQHHTANVLDWIRCHEMELVRYPPCSCQQPGDHRSSASCLQSLRLCNSFPQLHFLSDISRRINRARLQVTFDNPSTMASVALFG